MPSSRKITNRFHGANHSLSKPSFCEISQPSLCTTIVVQPRHAHLPNIPAEGELSFALMALFFGACAMGLQYLHLYKTAWWLPHSHAVYAMNFHLIDPHLIGYLLSMVFLPFLYSLLTQIRSISSRRCTFWLSCLFFFVLTSAWCVMFSYVSYHVYKRTSGLYVILLLYPCFTYASVFGSHVPGQLYERLCVWLSSWGNSAVIEESIVRSASNSPRASPSHVASTSMSMLLPPSPSSSMAPALPTSTWLTLSQAVSSTPVNKGALTATTTSMTSTTRNRIQMLRHNCSSNAEEVREETERFKRDFNQRLRIVLFSTLFCFFYASLVPLMFIQTQNAECNETCWNTVHYEGFWCGQHVAITAISAFLLYTVHRLPPVYVDQLHRCALHLGRWQKVEARNAHVPYNAWSELQIWHQSALVKHVRGLFRAEGINNAAEPGNAMHSRFFVLFYSPLRVVKILQLLIILVVLYQFTALLLSVEWYKMLSVSIMMFFNLHTLYKLLRNWLILSRCYKEELAVQQNTSVTEAGHPHMD